MLSGSPSAHEFEISLFGRGVGECIVVHVGAGDWIVIDSCWDETRRPVALAYLELLGVDPKTAVKLIAISHWHDDHCKGTAALLQECSSALFSCAVALRSTEFLSFAALQDETRLESSGVREFSNILAQLKSYGDVDQRVRYAIVGRTVHRFEGAGRPFDCTIHALSPGDAAMTRTYAELAAMIPEITAAMRGVPPQTANELCVVHWIQAGELRLVLGSDLENRRNAWNEVCDAYSLAGLTGQGSIFKVPHHGSANAHSETIWQSLVSSDSLAALTTYNAGVAPLPRATDIERIRTLSREAYCTTVPRSVTPKRRPSPVERTLRGMTRDRRLLRGPLGHVRVRCDPTAPDIHLHVELNEHACRL